MSFKTYAVSPQPDASWRLHSPEPVRFSGRHGLIARHVAALAAAPGADDSRWSAGAEVWLSMIAPGEPNRRWIVFEECEDDTIRLSRLTAINGIAHGGRTELLLHFSPLTLRQAPPTLVIRVPAEARAWCEGLALDGCAERPDAPWRWCERTLNIGAAVMGGQHSPQLVRTEKHSLS